MITVTRKLEIDAGHRLLAHEGKCRNVHGHRYVFEVTCMAAALDSVGRVIDFGEVKRLLGAWLDAELDHAYIAQRGDAIAEMAERGELRVYWLPVAPTAENLAIHVFNKAVDLLGNKHIKVLRVRCYETPNCYAEYGPSPLP